MSTFWQTVILAILPVLVAGRVALTPTSRLRREINKNLDLLGRLPAEHPNRATLEARNGYLLDVLAWRQFRRFYSLAPPASLTPPATPNFPRLALFITVTGLLAIAYLLGGLAGVYRPPVAPELLWLALPFYVALTVGAVGLTRWTAKLAHEQRRLLQQVSETPVTAPEGSA